MESYCNQCQGQRPDTIVYDFFFEDLEDDSLEGMPKEALETKKGIKTLAEAFFCILDIIELGVTIPCRNIVNFAAKWEHFDSDDIYCDIVQLERCQSLLKNYFFGE